MYLGHIDMIKTEEKYLEALHRLDELTEQDDTKGLDILEACELTTLIHSICNYEDEHYPIIADDDELSADMKKSLMKGLTEARLGLLTPYDLGTDKDENGNWYIKD